MLFCTLIFAWLFSQSQSRNVFEVPERMLGDIQPPARHQHDSSWSNGHPIVQGFPLGNDLSFDPNSYEINVDHPKYIPTIEGRPIYIPPVFKFDEKNYQNRKQYSKTTRPWHYYGDFPMSKYGHVDEREKQELSNQKAKTKLPPQPSTHTYSDIPMNSERTGQYTSSPKNEKYGLENSKMAKNHSVENLESILVDEQTSLDGSVFNDHEVDFSKVGKNEFPHTKEKSNVNGLKYPLKNKTSNYDKDYKNNYTTSDKHNIRKIDKNSKTKVKESKDKNDSSGKPYEPSYKTSDIDNIHPTAAEIEAVPKSTVDIGKHNYEVSVPKMNNTKDVHETGNLKPKGSGKHPVKGNSNTKHHSNQKNKHGKPTQSIGKPVLKNVYNESKKQGNDHSQIPSLPKVEKSKVKSQNQSKIKSDASQNMHYEIEPKLPISNQCGDCAIEDSEETEVDLDEESAKTQFMDVIDTKFRSLVFNPSAQSHEKFQSCLTPANESGSCRYVQHCLLPNILGAIDQFMDYVCIIQDRYVGVCCPEYPVTAISVKWDGIEVNNTTPNNSISNSITETPEECGISTKTRIVGGQKADPKEYPWMAALLTMSTGRFFCGGALINNRYVLTAAHCTYNIPRNQILVRLGEYDFSDKEESAGEDFPVIEIKRHGQYSRRTLRNDIALLKLARPVNFASHISTICLPMNNSFENTNATLAGWGNVKGGGPSSDVLLEATFPVLENKKCAQEHGFPLADTAICTKSTPNDKGACNGDSGGPLMVLDEESKHWYVIGVVSWGRRGCDPKFPTVYARVTEYLDWIRMHAI